MFQLQQGHLQGTNCNGVQQIPSNMCSYSERQYCQSYC